VWEKRETAWTIRQAGSWEVQPHSIERGGLSRAGGEAGHVKKKMGGGADDIYGTRKKQKTGGWLPPTTLTKRGTAIISSGKKVGRWETRRGLDPFTRMREIEKERSKKKSILEKKGGVGRTGQIHDDGR